MQDITLRLRDWQQGDEQAMDEIMPLIYVELKRIATGYMRHERAGHTLQATALVHEAFLKLIEYQCMDWHSRGHFLAIAATIMRRILIDHARQNLSAKRGSGRSAIPLDNEFDLAVEHAPRLLALDEALKHLEAIDPQQSRLVELRYFGGLTVVETAEVLGVTSRTVKRRWRTAKMWLYRYLSGEEDDME